MRKIVPNSLATGLAVTKLGPAGYGRDGWDDGSGSSEREELEFDVVIVAAGLAAVPLRTSRAGLERETMIPDFNEELHTLC